MASLRCVTLVNTVALAIFGGHCRLSSESLKDPVLSSESENGDDDDDDWTTGSHSIAFKLTVKFIRICSYFFCVQTTLLRNRRTLTTPS